MSRHVHQVMPGAEPFTADGGPVGVLFVHGFTGSPSSLRAMAHAAADSGYSVDLPRLPGHGTSADDLRPTTWNDWTSAVLDAHDALAARTERVAVVALSAGCGWSCQLMSERPDVARAMFVNPLVRPFPDDLMQQIHDALEAGIDAAPGDGPDIAKPGVEEVSYPDTPLQPVLALQQGLHALQPLLTRVTAPMLLATSAVDNVIDRTNSDHLAAQVRGPIRRIDLERSLHVATQDHDQGLLIDEMLLFIKEVS